LSGLLDRPLEGHSEAKSNSGAASRDHEPCRPRFRRTPGAANMCCMAGAYTFAEFLIRVFGGRGPGTAPTAACP
jgi:hypothetical protein